MGALDTLTIREEGLPDETQASNYEAEAGLLQNEPEEASDLAPIAGLGSALSSASSLGSSYFKYLQGAG
jgi:hypothetical protein